MSVAEPYDLAVLGAGPAGLAAAVAAADAGAQVALVDAGARTGGQYYRHPPASFHADRPDAFHHDWKPFARLHEALESHIAAGRVTHLPRHHVWSAERGDYLTVRALVGEPAEGEQVITSRALVVATGAYDRQLPFPGWDLPGVMSAGGAQALLKGNQIGRAHV